MLFRQKCERKVIALSGDNWPDVAETAARIGRSERQTRRLCEDGKLAHRKDGKAYFIDPASVEQFISEASRKPLPAEDMSDSPDPESSSRPVSVAEAEPDADIRTLTPDANRSSDTDADTPTDIETLSIQLRSSIQAVRTSHESMSDIAEQVFQHLAFEYRRNRDIEGWLQEMITELNIQPAVKSRKKALRQFRTFLPWILFGISSGITCLVWLW